MRLATTAAAVLVWTGTAYADAGVPTNRVPVRVSITADPPPPGVELFAIVDMAGAHRLLPNASLVQKGDPRTRGVSFTVYAVPSAALAPFHGTVPPDHWFRADNPDSRVVGRAHVVGRLDFFDGRSEEVAEYRVERVPHGVELRRVSDNAVPRRLSGPCGLVVSAALIWLIWFGVRRARRQGATRPPS